MESRYTFMSESKVIDDDGDTWPDPMSINYGNFKLSTMIGTHTISAGDIAKFWEYYYRIYQSTAGDDLLLSLNGIPYIGCLEPGDKIVEIPPADLISFTK